MRMANEPVAFYLYKQGHHVTKSPRFLQKEAEKKREKLTFILTALVWDAVNNVPLQDDEDSEEELPAKEIDGQNRF